MYKIYLIYINMCLTFLLSVGHFKRYVRRSLLAVLRYHRLNKTQQEAVKTTATYQNIAQGGNSRRFWLWLVYIGHLSPFGLSAGDISPSQNGALPRSSSLPVALLSYCLRWFPSTLWRWIPLMLLVSLPSRCLSVRLRSHDAGPACEQEEDQELGRK